MGFSVFSHKKDETTDDGSYSHYTHLDLHMIFAFILFLCAKL